MLKYLTLLSLLVAAPLAAQTVSQTRAQVPPGTAMQTNVAGNANGTAVVVSGYASVMLSVTASVAMSGGTTINFECQSNGTFSAVSALKLGSTTVATTTTTTGDFQIAVGSYLTCRARVSAYSAGTMTVVGYPSVMAPASYVITSTTGGGGAAVTIADGADVAQGTTTDAKSTATDATSVTLMQVFKEISFMEQTPASRAVTNVGTFAVQVSSALPAGANVIGHIIADTGSTTAVTGNVATTVADAANVNQGANADAAVVAGAVGTISAKLRSISRDLVANIVLAAGSNVIGHVIADTGSTTAVTGNVATTVADGSNVNQGANADAAVTAGATGTISAKLRSISRDLVANIVLAAGTNVIGHVIADTGSTTAVTGNVTVVQPTASSLNATVVGTGTLAVQPAGSVAFDGAGAGVNPILGGCYASAAAPTDVSADNDATRAWCLRNGAAVNQPSYAGVLAGTGVGAAGTSTPRVVDVASGTTGIAPPTQAAYIGGVTSGATGGFLTGLILCDSQGYLDMTTATTTEIAPLVASRTVYICSILAMANGTTVMTFKRGTGTNCGTGTASISPALDLTAQVGFTLGNGAGVVLGPAGAGTAGGATTSGNAVCVTSSANVNLHILIRYAVF